MSKPSQGLRALASMLETVAPEIAPAAQAALGDVVSKLHAAADAQARDEATRIGGPVAGPTLATFATTMVDGFFSLFQAKGASATAG